MATAQAKPARKATATPASKKTAPTKDKTAETAQDVATASMTTYANAAREQFDQLVSEFSSNTDQFRGQLATLTSSVNEGVERTRTHFTEVSTECVEVAKEEMSDAIQYANDLTKAKSLTDVFEINRDYWTNLLEARTEFTRDIAERTMAVTRENAEPFTSQAPNLFAGANLFSKFFTPASKA